MREPKCIPPQLISIPREDAVGTRQLGFDLAQAEKVSLRVYDARGRRVRTLISGRKEAGAYTVTWTGDDDRGRSVASGVYYARLVAGGVRQEKTMTLVR